MKRNPNVGTFHRISIWKNARPMIYNSSLCIQINQTNSSSSLALGQNFKAWGPWPWSYPISIPRKLKFMKATHECLLSTTSVELQFTWQKIQYVQKIKITDARSTAGCFRIATGSLSDHKKKLFISTLLRPLVWIFKLFFVVKIRSIHTLTFLYFNFALIWNWAFFLNFYDSFDMFPHFA